MFRRYLGKSGKVISFDCPSSDCDPIVEVSVDISGRIYIAGTDVEALESIVLVLGLEVDTDSIYDTIDG